MSGLRRATGLAALVLFEVAAVAALHRLGALPWMAVPWDGLTGWLASAPPADVVAALARLAALGLAWWMLGSTALYVLARASRVPAAARAAGWLTLPAVRRLADQAIALTLAGSMASGGGALAASAAPTAVALPRAVAAVQEPPDPPAYRPQPAGLDAAPPAYRPQPAGPDQPPRQPTTTTGEPSYTPRPAGMPETPAPSSTTPASQPPEAATSSQPAAPTSRQEPDPPGYVPRPAGTGGTAAPPTAATPPAYQPLPAGIGGEESGPRETRPEPEAGAVHRVVEGDNLWTIARDHLARATGRRPAELGEREIARYWLRVVEANRASLRSGDPDLIYPGEQVRLPPPG